MNAFSFLWLVLPFFSVQCQKMVKVQSYRHLVSYMGRGADVRYFFNASTCVTSAKTSQSSDEIPVIGGELKLFIGSKDPDDGHLFFSQVRYVDNNPNNLTAEIQTIYVINDTAMVFWETTGFFVNNTGNPDGVYCNWTRGEGSIWVKQHPQRKQMTSFNEIRSALISGEKIRWVANLIGCNCPSDSGPDECTNSFVGDTITDFKISDNGSIRFTSSSTSLVPLSWVYARMIVFGHIYQNNTVNFMISLLDPTTWDDGDDEIFLCPIALSSAPKGVGFFLMDP
uniref:Uncharacterized protein n=1 Tax=Magallana gigas TaxID=29159 RepID=A0A8W8N6K4_MAGGI|nr:uncharacterized protein LOC117681296 [Crassostrea gigas]